jgi:hypothetical protein
MLLAPKPEELTFRVREPEVYVLFNGDDMKTPETKGKSVPEVALTPCTPATIEMESAKMEANANAVFFKHPHEQRLLATDLILSLKNRSVLPKEQIIHFKED